MSQVDLSHASLRGYSPGRPYWFRALWLLVEALTLLNPVFVSYRMKATVLRAFGAKIGRNVVIKPSVHVKYPWRFLAGDNSWIGERSWIDNFVIVSIGPNACVSQGAYLCTGNHDWSDPGMGLMAEPITVEEGAWIGAFARIAPGVTIGRESVVTLGAVVLASTEPGGIYAGNPAIKIRQREFRNEAAPSFPTVHKAKRRNDA